MKIQCHPKLVDGAWMVTSELRGVCAGFHKDLNVVLEDVKHQLKYILELHPNIEVSDIGYYDTEDPSVYIFEVVLK